MEPGAAAHAANVLWTSRLLDAVESSSICGGYHLTEAIVLGVVAVESSVRGGGNYMVKKEEEERVEFSDEGEVDGQWWKMLIREASGLDEKQEQQQQQSPSQGSQEEQPQQQLACGTEAPAAAASLSAISDSLKIRLAIGNYSSAVRGVLMVVWSSSIRGLPSGKTMRTLDETKSMGSRTGTRGSELGLVPGEFAATR